MQPGLDEHGSRGGDGNGDLTSHQSIALAQPTWTWVLLAANVLMFVAMTAYGLQRIGVWNGTEYTPILVLFGAKVNELIANGQVWRLGSAMFMHIGIVHLLINMYSLYAMGPLVEGFFGNRRFLAIYLVGGLWGSTASYAFSDALSAGASGAIFGLAGATVVYFLKYRDAFGKRASSILQQMAGVIVVNLFLGYSSQGIDNWGHIGGLLGGAAAALGMVPKYRPVSGTSVLAAEEFGSRETWFVVGHAVALWFAVRWVTARFLAGG